MMTLKRFRVLNFRSVEDSEWVETDDVTALIGTNEAGKTNLLLPLWKFNPAKEGALAPTSDYPRKHYADFRKADPKPTFIRTQFEADADLTSALVAITGLPIDDVRVVEVAKTYDDEFFVTFPKAKPATRVSKDSVLEIIQKAEHEMNQMSPLKTEEDLKRLLLSSLSTATTSIKAGDLDAADLNSILATLEGVKTDTAPKSSTIVPRHNQTAEQIRALREGITRAHPDDVPEAADLVLKQLPVFVFYSTYGNLDSEIYLPHVIENMTRKGLGIREQAKVRTLKVLFEFVGLEPQEILELGRDFKDPSRKPTDLEIADIAEKKKQRSILLQSASAQLTLKFREWWKQGEYRFRFEADGDHFRIWVSDDRRPDEIELEGRSTGLQWFLSFYLVFLVERSDAHSDAVLLLDEPGLSLHPLAQRDLSDFFDNLAKANQLIYACHSPFLVDPDRLDRARKVYTGADGTTHVTADLREGDAAQRGAAYAVHAAVGLSVAESLLLGCEPVVVEGPSDQHYLTAMKTLLVGAGRLKPGREIVFPPAGGSKGVRAVASVLGGRDGVLPIALFDSDVAGRETVKSLRKDLYAGEPHLVLDIAPFVDNLADAEIEDLIPVDLMIKELDRWLRSANVPFTDEYKAGLPITPQIETWASRNGIVMQKPGWKAELAKRVKQQLLADGHEKLDGKDLARWESLFSAFRDARTKSS